MLLRLEDAGHLIHEKEGRRNLYHPTGSRERARDSALSRLLDTFFRNSPVQAVAAILDRSADDLTEEELSELDAVSLDELRSDYESGEVVLVDVRPDDEYRSGHISGAKSIPVEELEEALEELPEDREIVAYCRGPYCLLSDEAVERLRREGYDAKRLDVGYPEWRAEGLPVDEDTE